MIHSIQLMPKQKKLIDLITCGIGGVTMTATDP